ncbi:MAG: hypothetical protein NT150_05675 [Bacteroidetes bacterium]|nr:hypothetical protein [Bacteroidota bacterium]
MVLILVLIFVFIFNNMHAACTAMPAEPACSGTLAANNASLNSGNTYYYNGGTLSGINLNGGTLILCSGTTTLSATLNSGIIYIKTGAVLNTAITTIPSNCSVYNFGQLNFTAGLALNNATAFMNALGAKIAITGNFTGNGCTFTNYGGVTATGTLGDWQNSGGICQGNDARIAVTSISWSSLDNWVSTPTGSSCISYTSSATSGNSHPFSANAGTNVCQKTGASSESGTGSWGTATLTQSCTGCDAILPIELLYFKVTCDYTQMNAEWSTASEINNSYFEVEASRDGQIFVVLNKTEGAGNSSATIEYAAELLKNSANYFSYFRLKQVDYNGAYSYSKIIQANNCALNKHIQVLNNSFLLEKENNELTLGVLYNNLGQTIKTYNFSVLSNGWHSFDVSDLPEGIYFLTLNNQSSITINKRQ